MQSRQGYCSYCCVRYTNLEQHMSSAQHRYLTTQNRQRMGTSSLMERFLQDVLRHHPYHYQESRSRQNERLLRNTAPSSEVVPIDDSVPEEMADDATGVRGEIATKSFEPLEELYSRPSKSQEYMQGVPVRPSVIQKLEKGQQQPLEFVYKIGSGLKELNPVGIGQTTNNRQNLLYPSVISTAPASRLAESSHDRRVATNSTRLPLAAHSDSVIKCDPNKVDRYLEQRDRGSRNPMFSSHVAASSVIYQKPKESNRKSVFIKSDKLSIQEDVKSRGKTLSTGFKPHECEGTAGSLKFESLSKSAVNPAVNLNKTDTPSNKRIFEDATPKHHEKFFNMDRNQEVKCLVFKKSAFLGQKSSVSSEMEFACSSPQSVSDQPDEAVRDLWSEEQIDQENKNYESRGSEMSFDCSSSFHSLTGQSKVTAKEINLSKEVRAALQPKRNKSYVSEVSSDCDGPLQLATNRTQVIVKGISVQKAVPVSLVDECYDSSDSEMNFDCDTSLQSTDDYPQQPTKEVDLPNGAHIDLVDKSYGSSGSEISTDSNFPLQSVDQLPVAVTETELQKNVHVGLVDMNYGSSCSETSFDSDVSLQSVVVHPQRAAKESVVVYPQLAGKERNLKDRHVYLKDEIHRSSSARARFDCELSIEAVTHEPQRAVEEINLKEKNDLVDMNCEYYGSEMSFHTDAQLVADQPQGAVQEVKPQEVATDLQNKSANSSISDLSFDSHASLYQSSKEPLGTLSDINLKELSVDMEVRSSGCSSSELTFDSDPPVLSVAKHSELDVEEIRKKHVNLEDESYGSNSSEITFDSDIPHCSVVDQSRAAVYGEEPIGLRYKGNESCVSEIAFDSNKPLHSGTDHPGVVREIIVQKENYVNLGRTNKEPIGSEMSLDSYVPPHSVTNPPEVAVKRLNLQKEEQIYCESKENEPTGSELSLNYNIFHSVIGHSADLIKERNLQKEEHVHLENKGSGSCVSEMNLKSYASPLVTDHPDIAVKEINHQKEDHANVEHKGNELSVSERGSNFRTPFQSVIHKTAAAVKEMWLQKEKQLKFKDKSVKYSGSDITLGSDGPHYSVIEPQIPVKERNVQKEEHVLENGSNKSSGFEINLNSHVLPQSVTGKPQIAVLKKDHVDPEDESTESRGFEINFHIDTPRPSVIDQSRLALLKEKHVDLEGTNRESSVYKVHFNSNDPLQPLTEQFQEAVKQTNMWKVEDIGLENKVEPNGSKLIQDSDVSLRSLPDQPEAAAKQINLENEGHVYFEDNNSRYSSSEMSLDSDYLAQSVVDQSQVTILEKQHIELEDKHHQTCGSEISFDSDDPLQSVAETVRETVKEISLWKDEDVEDRGDKSQGFEIMYDSNIPFQSVAGQTEEVIKEINLWKKHVDLEGKIVKLGDSKINFVSDGPLQPVTNEIQEAATEINLVREGHICLDDKVYEPNDSQVIYVSDVPLQSVVEHSHVLEDDHVNLEDKSNDPCGPEVSFASDGPLPSVADELQKTVKVVNVWKEDRIYLGDKSYKLGDFEVSYDSDVPLMADQSPVVIKQTDLHKKDHNDLENKICEPSVSEIKCDSGIHLQLEVDHPQMVCKEINLQRIAHLGMEEKTSDSEVMSDSDVPLQIVVNEFQVSVKEANLQKMLFVDLVTSDSDCEMISDSGIPYQPVIDSSQMTVEGIDCINAKSFDLEGECYDCCDSESAYVCEASPQSVSNQSKKTFKVINQKKDYIILEESGCESYGSEINFQIDASHQSLACQSPGSDKKVISYIDPEDKSCEPNSPKRNFKWEDTSQPVTHNPEVNFWKDPETTGPKDKNCECSVSAVDCNASSESAILQMADEDNLLKLKCTESMSCEPCGSGMNFQCDPSLQSDTDQPQEAINKVDLCKKIPVDVKEKKHDSRSSSVPKVDPIKNRKKTKEVIEDNTDEPVLEALPHVPPSFVGKTWSQIMKEDDMKINALVKEFKEGRFHCYFDDDCETRKVKKKNLNEEKKITSADLNDTALIQVLLDCDDIIDDFSVALDKPSHHHPTEKRPYEQTWRVASRCQAVKVSHGTQTNLMSYLVTKGINGQEDDSPTRKRLLLHNDRKPKKIKIGTVEFLESCTNILKPLHPNALVYVLSSNIKLKEGDSFNFSKMRHCSDKNQDFSIQCKYKQSSFNYDPLSKQIVINPPLNIEVPESDRNNWVQIHFSDLNSSTGDDDAHVQSSTTIPFMTLSVRHELMSHQGASGSCVFLEKAEILNSSDDAQESKFQLTLLNGDVEISPKSVRNKSLESKKKIQRRKVTNNKPGFLKKVHRPIILQQKTRITSEKPSIWIQTKPNDIIRKYLSKYSMFLRRKYQSRSAFISMHHKKKPDVSRLKEVQRPAKMLSNSVPSAGGEEQLRAIASSSPKQPVQDSSSKAGKKSGNKKKPRKKKRRPKPVRIYDLRSLYSQVPYSDRMMTRLLHKLLLSKAH